jgi:hypothetical protein
VSKPQKQGLKRVFLLEIYAIRVIYGLPILVCSYSDDRSVHIAASGTSTISLVAGSIGIEKEKEPKDSLFPRTLLGSLKREIERVAFSSSAAIALHGDHFKHPTASGKRDHHHRHLSTESLQRWSDASSTSRETLTRQWRRETSCRCRCSSQGRSPPLSPTHCRSLLPHPLPSHCGQKLSAIDHRRFLCPRRGDGDRR